MVRPVFAQGPDESVRILSLVQQDLDGDGAPDLTVIDCAFITEYDRVFVYDRGGDMQISDQWNEATDFENDLWVFDAAADGQVELIIDFYRSTKELVAAMWDDQNGDGTVRYQGWPEMRIQESAWPTVRVTAPGGWWTRNGKNNFNLSLVVDGPVRAAFQAPVYLKHLETDGVPDFQIEIQDVDADGHPDTHWINAWPEASPYQDIYRTELMVNSADDEPPITGSIFWPFLGSALEVEGPRESREAQFIVSQLPFAQKRYGFLKDYHVSFPPIQVAWHKAAIAYIGEFVASRSNDATWFVYSFVRAEPNELSPVDFEAPFSFYDIAADDDGYPELQIRLVQRPAEDVYLPRTGGHTPIQVIHYSWDQDNNRTWDYKVGLIGRHTIAETFRVGNLLLNIIPPTVLPDWINEQDWDGVTFVAVEKKGYWTSEGIYAWGPSPTWRDEYVTGLLDAPPEEEYQTIDSGFRGEYAFDLQSRPVLYFSPIDHRLHLRGATKGIWNIDGSAQAHYADLDSDGYLDQWVYTEPADMQAITVTRQLNVVGSFLIYSGDDEVILRQLAIEPALFETLPPRNHKEWRALGEMLEANRREFAPGDFRAMMAQFAGPEWRVQGARMRDLRPDGEGFRFILELLPGFQVNGSGGLALANLPPGAYVVTHHREFDIRPLTPARLEILPDTFRLSQPAPVALESLWIEAAFHNAGLEDVPSLWVQAYAEGPDSPLQLADETEIALLAGQTTPVQIPWAPSVPGAWRITLAWGDDRSVLPASALGITALPVDVDAPQAVGSGTIWYLSNVSQPAVLVLLLASLGLTAAALAGLYIRAAGDGL